MSMRLDGVVLVPQNLTLNPVVENLRGGQVEVQLQKGAKKGGQLKN